MQTSPTFEQIKTLNGPRVRGISPVGRTNVQHTNAKLIVRNGKHKNNCDEFTNGNI